MSQRGSSSCPLTFLAAIEDPTVIAKIFAYLGLPTRASPKIPARLDAFDSLISMLDFDLVQKLTGPLGLFSLSHATSEQHVGHHPVKGPGRLYVQGEAPHGRRHCSQIDPAIGTLVVFYLLKKAF